EAIDRSFEQILQAQLDSQSSHLGELCARLVSAYDMHDVSEEVQSDLMSLSAVLREPAAVPLRLKETQLSGLCISLSENVAKMAGHYDEPNERELDLLRKIT